MKPSPLRQHWAQHIETWRSSDLSQNAYCRERNLKPNQFSYWKRKLAVPNAEHNTKSPSASTAFIPLSVGETNPSAQCFRLRLPNGCELSDIDVRDLPLIKQLIEALL